MPQVNGNIYIHSNNNSNSHAYASSLKFTFVLITVISLVILYNGVESELGSAHTSHNYKTPV